MIHMNHSALKLLTISLLLLALSSAAAWYMFYQQEKNGEAIRASWASLKAWEELQNSASAGRADEDAADERRLQSLVISAEGETVEFLAFIDELSAKSGALITATGLKVEKTPEARFDNLSATFSIQGERSTVERLIRVFESLPYRSHVTSLSLTRNADRTAAANLSLIVSVRE